MNRILVAYFSVSGRTKQLAQKLARCVRGQLHEIMPKEMYTEADVNWMDKNSRSSIEMRNESARPEISNFVQDMSLYNVLYVGFPIWWYVAPRIVNTFLGLYDMSGKIVVPFATSGGSGMGDTNEKLAPLCRNATLIEGRVFRPDIDEDVLKKWAVEVIGMDV